MSLVSQYTTPPYQATLPNDTSTQHFSAMPWTGNVCDRISGGLESHDNATQDDYKTEPERVD